MLNNQLHQGGTRALLDWDNDLFTNLTLPGDLNTDAYKTAVVDDILFRHGDAPLAYPDPAIMKYYIGVWSRRMGPLWLRYYTAINIDYEPLENYNRIENREEVREDENGNTRTLNTQTAEAGTVTTENKVSAENESVYQPDTQTVETPATTSSDTGTIRDAGTYTGSTETESRIHGNIGVTTSQQMLQSELDLVPRLDIVRYISDNYAAEFCLGVY